MSFSTLEAVCLALFLFSDFTQAAIPDRADTRESYVVDSLLKTEQARQLGIVSYTRLQHYTATADRFGQKAEMLVSMHYQRSKGKTFQVLSRSGSSTIQSRIFDKLLKAEVESSIEAIQDGSLLNRANYSFHLVGKEEYAGRSCFVLRLDPLKPDKRLIRNKAWIDAQEFAPVHFEGRPDVSLSFWVGRPMIGQDFAKVGKYWLASKRHSASDTFVLGHSELTIEYKEYQLKEQ